MIVEILQIEGSLGILAGMAKQAKLSIEVVQKVTSRGTEKLAQPLMIWH